MGITGDTTSAHLYGRLEEDLRRDLQKSNPAERVADMTEGNFLAAAKRLAVKEETKQQSRMQC